MGKKIPLPKGKYIKNIEIVDDALEVSYGKKKKVALLFIAINERYWPYLKQVMEDCQTNFLPHHHVDFFVWSDIPEVDTPEYLARLDTLKPDAEFTTGDPTIDQWWGRETIESTVNFIRAQANLSFTEPIGWPAPTLMRYHLFLNEEEKLKDYDYIFYMDADMRVVDKVSDEVLGNGLTAAEHPGYSLGPRYIPPYEPNKASTAYIHRLGEVIDDNGRPRFKPYYVAGGFQGGVASHFIKAMKKMKWNIDKDFNANYTAIWNDESHWNKYLWDYYRGHLIVLSPSYVYPDSLIKEYYVPLWGKEYPPKIVTLTKPFSLSKEGGAALHDFLGKKPNAGGITACPTCNDRLESPGYQINSVVSCPGSGKAHQVDMVKL